MIDLTGRTDVPVAEEVLSALQATCRKLGLEFLVVGAAARDLTIHALQRSTPIRATEDIDIAVAVRVSEQFDEFAKHLKRKGESQHKFEVLGIEVDVVPFGGLEHDRKILFADDHLLDVNGLQEPYATSIAVRMPHGTELRVASAPAQTALKVLAWRDRHDVNPKDGLDLRVILSALSEDPFVEEVWDDLEALDATDYDIIAAASYHYARQAAEGFVPADGIAIVNTLEDVQLRPQLLRHMRSEFAPTLIDAYARGFIAGLER